MRPRIAVSAAASLLVLLTACGPLAAGEGLATSASGRAEASQAHTQGAARSSATDVSPTGKGDEAPGASGVTEGPVVQEGSDPAGRSEAADAGDATDGRVAEASKDDAVLSSTGRADRGRRPASDTSTTPLTPDTGTPSSSPSPSARGDRIGVSIPAGYLHHADGDAMNRRLDEVAALGARWVRTDANWSWIEPRQGRPDWSELDALMSAADARGLDVLLVVHTVPAWARPVGTPEWHGPSTDAERAAYVDFSRRLATRYAGRVDAWEVWNEPNLDQAWAPAPDPQDYTALLQDVYPVLKSADPATPVLIGGAGHGGTGDIDSATWYQGVYANGGQSFFDVANIHPYQDWRAAAAGKPDTGVMARVPAVRQVMADNGDAAKPMWGTEFGAPTHGSTATTEDGQRVVYTEGRDLWFSRESGPLFAYYGRDRLAYGASTKRTPYYGLMRSDGTRKPAYDALAGWIAGG